MACCVSWDALGLSNRKYVGFFLEENNILEWQRIGKPSKTVDKLYCTMSQEEYKNCVRKKISVHALAAVRVTHHGLPSIHGQFNCGFLRERD